MIRYINKTGQFVAEYALLIAVLVTALIVMGVLIQRSVRSNVSVLEKQAAAKPLPN